MSWTPGYSIPAPNEDGGDEQVSPLPLLATDEELAEALAELPEEYVKKDGSNLDGPDVDDLRDVLNLEGDIGLPVVAGQWTRLGGPVAEGLIRGGAASGSGGPWLNTSTVASLSTTLGQAPAIGGGSGANPTLVNLNGWLYLRRTFLAPCTIDRLAIRQMVQGPASSTMDLVIYDDQSPTYPGYPGELVASASMAMDTGGALASRSVAFAYEHPGGYAWLGVRFLESAPSGSAGSMVGIVIAGEAGGWQLPYVDTADVPAGWGGVSHSGTVATGFTGVLGDDPANGATFFAQIAVPAVFARIASVP